MVEPFHSKKTALKKNKKLKDLYIWRVQHTWCLSCLTGSYIRIAHVLVQVYKYTCIQVYKYTSVQVYK